MGFSLPGLAICDTHDRPKNPEWWSIMFVGGFKTERAKDRRYVATDNVRRIQEITGWMVEKFTRFKVTHCVVELPNSGAKSSNAAKAMALATGQVAAMLVALKIQAHYYLPHQTKQFCTGNKDAEKPAMIAAAESVWEIQWPKKSRQIKNRSPIDVKQQEAISDALCALITYAKNPKTSIQFLQPLLELPASVDQAIHTALPQ